MACMCVFFCVRVRVHAKSQTIESACVRACVRESSCVLTYMHVAVCNNLQVR
jgi:hypothetical protein